MILDVESVVRPTASSPEGERRIYQIGAVRVYPGRPVGNDCAAAEGDEVFSAYVRLPDAEWESLLRNPRVQVAYGRDARPADEVLRDFRAWLADDDVLVAYNGTAADFPWLDAEAERAGLPSFDGMRLVDALYIAQTVWPHQPGYRLGRVAGELKVNADGLRRHDAVDDAILTGRLLVRAATDVASWPSDLRDLLFAVTRGSAAWDLLAALGVRDVPAGTPCAGHNARILGQGRDPAGEPPSDEVIAGILARELTPAARRRGLPRPHLEIPDRFRHDGRVDPFLLARALLKPKDGSPVRERPAQRKMAERVAEEIAAGRDVLVEAPTGTGKSLALLATALDWLSAGPQRRVVIATYTSQLQRQLAGDVARLGERVPGILPTADVVRGRAGRLSLRALVAVLADAARQDRHGGLPHGRHERAPFTASVVFGELLAWLVRRLITARTALERWWASSADAGDVTPFLAEYVALRAGPVLGVWLESVSQTGGDYGADTAGPLTAHTDSVDEALVSHRLIVANHALLLSHIDGFSLLGRDTLLIVDEAHSVEHAATQAAGAEVDYRAVENLVAQAGRWIRERQDVPQNVRQGFEELEAFLDTARLPREAAAVFDAEGGEPGRRTATLASPYAGIGRVPAAGHLVRELSRLAGYAARAQGPLGAWARTDSAAALSWWERERVRSLVARLGELATACDRIAGDADRVMYPDRHRMNPTVEIVSPASETDSGDASDAEDGEPTSADEELRPAEEELGEDRDRANAPDSGFVSPPAPPAWSPNQVVHAREIDVSQMAYSPRRYGFAVATSPIELARDVRWRHLRSVFARSVFVSATLRVSGSWDYITRRLGLGDEVARHYLPGAFDLRRQARLVCFTDFPSWAEQADGAMRTVAHQLAGYAREVVARDPDDDRSGPRGGGGRRHGALVLTTSTAAASGISEHLLRLLPGTAPEVPVHVAPFLGNARAVAEFTSTGGFCVATRGLWQGVDFPADRIGLVWINKLPFAPFADPVVAARRAAVAARAEEAGDPDPDRAAAEQYYLPLAAMDLRQAVGRLIRSSAHAGVVVISDRRLAGASALRRTYREVFLGSLEEGLLEDDPSTGEQYGGNLVTMADGWARIWRFLAGLGRISPGRAEALCGPDELARHTLLPQTLAVRNLELTEEQVDKARADGELADLVTRRCAEAGGHLRFEPGPLKLRPYQEEVLCAVAEGRDVLALLPTGAGKSYTFQLPALILPGITVVVSPLVALMADQALELNATIGGSVRALVGPLAESNSRMGKTEVVQELTGQARHGIKLVYLSPERLADRRFAEALRAAARRGALRRIAVDEAHTFVQWGDDFRPSFRRAGRLLTELRKVYGVRVTAVTATANASVVEGLRTGLFGATPEPVAGEALVTVRSNPLRPELAVYRRWLGKGGPVAIAGLAEQVVTVCDGHCIVYCLTVKEVEALYAHLRAFVGETGSRRIRRFHGRLSDAEKASVLTEFREAPSAGEEGFVPLVVVATAAFGLGVNRLDIRAVFVASPPTDLAALYQQIGRAGRDQAQRDVETEVDRLSAGLALGTGRGLRTVAWMGAQGLPDGALRRIGEAVLGAAERYGWLDASELADMCLEADVLDGLVGEADARRSTVVEQYRTAIVSAVAVLSVLEVVVDGGDFPAGVRISAPDGIPVSGETDPAGGPPADDVPARVAALVGGRRGARQALVPLVDLHRELAARVAGYREWADDPAATWSLLAALHDAGRLDVSQAGNRRTLIAVRLTEPGSGDDGDPRGAPPLPEDFVARMTARQERQRRELVALREWYTGTRTCAVAGFASYFLASEIPKGTCQIGLCRCSTCWSQIGDVEEGAPPALLTAFQAPRPRPAARRDGGQYRHALDRWIRALLWDCYRGLTPGMLHRVLRGEETYVSLRSGRRRPLWPRLLYHRLRGIDPGIRRADVGASLNRLAEDGAAVEGDGGVWRLAEHAARDARRARANLPGLVPGAGGEGR